MFHRLTSFCDSYLTGELLQGFQLTVQPPSDISPLPSRKVFAVSGAGGIRGTLMQVCFLHLFSSLENTHFDFKNMCGFFPLPLNILHRWWCSG